MIQPQPPNPVTPTSCDAVRDALETLPLGAPRLTPEHIADHLATCEACSDFRDDLDHVRGLVDELPGETLPDDALEAVWDRTIRTPVPIETTPVFAMQAWRSRGLAAAAILLVTALASWTLWRQPPPTPHTTPATSPSEAELAKIDRQLEQVLALVSTALHRTEHLALQDILVEETAPSLQVLPMGGITTYSHSGDSNDG